MKKLAFLVTLEFDAKITSDDDIKLIAENIAIGLEHQVNTGTGLAPQEMDNYTKSIEVSQSGLILSTIKLV